MTQLSKPALAELEQMLGEAIVTPLADGEVRILWGPLPGRLITAVAWVDGVLWFVIDDAKPMMRGHAAELLADARVACGPGVLRLRRIPTAVPNQRRPIRLELVS